MKAVGIILAGGNNERLEGLNSVRATSAMPVGGCYRIIDFAISNMANSGIQKIAVITQYNFRSLHDHLSSSKWWDLGRKHGGLFVFTPFLKNETNNNSFQGTADSIYQNLNFLNRSKEQYVIISSGNCIFKMDFAELIKYHADTGADITIAAKDMAGTDIDLRKYGVLTLDGHNNIIEFEEKPIETEGTVISLGIYIMSRTLLISLLEEGVSEARYDFVKDILIRYRKKMKYNAYMFNDYWRAINSVGTYYQANMDFLDENIRRQLVHNSPYIESKPKDQPPAKFNLNAKTSNCLVGSGSILNGTTVDSVIFRKVFAGENTYIKSSIIMEEADIGKHCFIENAIIDKEVTISDGAHICGSPEAPRIIKKGTKI